MVPNEMDTGSEANISSRKISVAELAVVVRDSLTLSDERSTRLEDRIAKLEERQAATDK
jgi:hypothetical protein